MVLVRHLQPETHGLPSSNRAFQRSLLFATLYKQLRLKQLSLHFSHQPVLMSDKQSSAVRSSVAQREAVGLCLKLEIFHNYLEVKIETILEDKSLGKTLVLLHVVSQRIVPVCRLLLREEHRIIEAENDNALSI